jgi:xylulokinase
VGYVERWCLEVAADLGAEMGDTVYTTGGGARSSEWLQVRASILNRRVVRPRHTECAIGTAAVAASNTLFPSLGTAVRAMVETGEAVDPDPARTEVYAERYQAFREACSRRGYE